MEKLQLTHELYFFVKEALALRGIPDVFIFYRGKCFAWELKKSESELFRKDGTMKLVGRTVLQYIVIEKIKATGNVGRFVYPENEEEAFAELLAG